MLWKNHLSQSLDIKYPVVQAPMLGCTTPQMVAQVANCGGLGSLPVGGLSPAQTLLLIQETKALTNKPFAVNLFVNDNAQVDVPSATAMQQFLQQLGADNGLAFSGPDIGSLNFYHYKQQIPILLDERIPIVSFTFGILDDESIAALKQAGTTLIGTATSVREAMLLDAKGIDMIAAQGIEAGGHRGTFLHDDALPQIGLFALLPQILRHTNKPVLAAGGINDGASIKAAMALGAQGVQIGTAFIAAHESLAIPSYKKALKTALPEDIVLTRAFTGRWARGIRNTIMSAIENAGIGVGGYPVQNSLTAPIRAAARKVDNKEFINLWAGQSAFKAQEASTAEIFNQLIADAEVND